MPVGLALPLGGADHWVVSDPCPGREHNAIALSTLLRPGTLRQGMGVVVRQTQTVESGRPRRHPPIACYAARRALALSLAAQLR